MKPVGSWPRPERGHRGHRREAWRLLRSNGTIRPDAVPTVEVHVPEFSSALAGLRPPSSGQERGAGRLAEVSPMRGGEWRACSQATKSRGHLPARTGHRLHRWTHGYWGNQLVSEDELLQLDPRLALARTSARPHLAGQTRLQAPGDRPRIHRYRARRSLAAGAGSRALIRHDKPQA